MGMNPEIKAKWVAALRSGEYKQGREILRCGNSFCCLGVLCDLHSKEGGGNWDERQGYEGSTGIPPASVAEWSGINKVETTDVPPHANPIVTINGRRMSIAEHNDHGRTFAEIADAIEAQL